MRDVTHGPASVVHYNGKGFVVWCSCGIGTPAKATEDEAAAAIKAHIADAPRENGGDGK